MNRGKVEFILPGNRVKHRRGLWQGPAIVQVACWAGRGQLLCVKARKQIFCCNAKEVKPCPKIKRLK